MPRRQPTPAGTAPRLADGRASLRHRLCLAVVAIATLASLTVSASTAHAADCAGANLLPTVVTVPTAKAATLCLLNGERAARGLVPLTSQPILESVAGAYSQAMVQGRFFAHVSPAGQTIEERLLGYVSSAGKWVVGENLAWGEGSRGTPAAIVKGWMESASHRANVLNGLFREIGIGIVGGSPAGSLHTASATYTTEFGTRVGSASIAASPSSTRAATTVASPLPESTKAKRVSAKKKQQISQRCHRVARRTKASKRTRTARFDRCVSKALRAASR